MDPHALLLAIAKLMDGERWCSETLETIADVLNENGYAVRQQFHAAEPPCEHIGPPGGICMRCLEEI
jgi:hypothetical protein